MENRWGKTPTNFVSTTYTVESGIVSPTSSSTSVASENDGRLVSETFELAAQNVSELKQLIAMWEAEEYARSEAEGEAMDAFYINQKVERYLHKFFTRRKVFAEHQDFIVDDVCPTEDRDVSSKYSEEWLTPLSSLPKSPFVEKATSAATEPFLVSSSGSSQQAAHPEMRSPAPFSPVPQPGQQGYLTALQASMLAIKAAYFVETVSTTQTRSFLSTEDTASVASCESAEDKDLDDESEDTDSTMSLPCPVMDVDFKSENVIEEVSKDKLDKDGYTCEPTRLSPLQVDTKQVEDSSSRFLTSEDLSLRIQASPISQVTPFIEKDASSQTFQTVSLQKYIPLELPKSQESKDITSQTEEYAVLSSSSTQARRFLQVEDRSRISAFGSTEEYIPYLVADMDVMLENTIMEVSKDNLATDTFTATGLFPEQAETREVDKVEDSSSSYSTSEDTRLTIKEYQFPRKMSFTEKEAYSPSKEKDIPETFQADTITPQTTMAAPSTSSGASSQQAVRPEITSALIGEALVPPIRSTQEPSVRQGPLTPLQLSLFAVRIASSIETKSSNQARSFLSADDQSPIFSLGSTEEKEPCGALEDSDSNKEVLGAVTDMDVIPENVIKEDNLFTDIYTKTGVETKDSDEVVGSGSSYLTSADTAQISMGFTPETVLKDFTEGSIVTERYVTKDLPQMVDDEVVGASISYSTSEDRTLIDRASQLPQVTSFAEKVASSQKDENIGESFQTFSLQSYVPLEVPEIERSKDRIPQSITVAPSFSSTGSIQQAECPEATSALIWQDFVSPFSPIQPPSRQGSLTAFTKEDLAIELEMYRAEEDSYGLMAEEVSSELLSVQVSSDFVLEEDSSDLVVEEDSSSLLTEADSSSLMAEEDSSGLAADSSDLWAEYFSGLVTRQGSSGLLVDRDSYGLVAVEDSTGLLAEEDSSAVVVGEDSSVLLVEEASYALVVEEASSGLVTEEHSPGLVAREDSYTVIAEEESSGLVAEEDSYGLLAEDDSYGLVFEARTSGLRELEDSYHLIAEDDSYELLTEEDSPGVLVEEDSPGLVAQEGSSSMLAQDYLYGVVAEKDSSCLIAKGDSPALLADRIALSLCSSGSPQPAERLEVESALMEKDIGSDTDRTPGSPKQGMVPVLGRVIKVMECIYTATEAPYFSGHTMTFQKKDS